MTARSSTTSVLAALLVTVLAGAFACERFGLRRSATNERAAARYPAVSGLGPAELKLASPPSDAHRILLDQRALTRLRESARLGTPAFQYVSLRADEALAKPLDSGYQGFEWADCVASLALAWHATGEPRYATAAIGYLRALLDDRFVVGDAKGGKDVVSYDSGYGIRTFGAYSALGYDWLRGAPGMDAALRARILERLEQWLGWYEKNGYLRDRPTANYYWGYLTALSFAGLAASGESTAADAWLGRARDELSTNVLPTFREELRGGGWPEGWQYGEYTTMEVALVAEAFRTGARIDIAGNLPWLAQTVTHHVHALLPDERSVYDGGTWGEHPARPSALALAAISVALEGVDDARAADARWMIAHALPPLRREQAWVGLLADRPGEKTRSPRVGAPTSLHLPGQGLTFARSDWSKAAVFTSFQAGARLAEDHQDADQGHFELARGADVLLVDGGGSEGSATINHNTLLVDDGGRHMNYPPNQGVWGKNNVKTTRFGDDGLVVVAVGDIGEAYAPSCAREGCGKRSVERLIRTLVYVRPSLLVVHDSVALERSDFAVTWAAHVTRSPTVAGNLASAVVGASRVDVRTLEPRDARPIARREPTPSGEGSHRLNQPWGPMWRIEIESPRDERERVFLHFITVGPADSPPPPSQGIAGTGLQGAAGRVDGRRSVVLFAGPDGEGRVALGGPADLVAIAGLVPGKRYRVAFDAGGSCTLHLSPSQNARDPAATSGGALRVSATQCGAK